MNDAAFQEQHVSNAFSRQSSTFDQIEEENKLLLWMRNRIHNEVMKYAKAGDYLLELNCGTGIDAVFFAQNNIKVKATDNAPGMLHELRMKVEELKLQDQIDIEQCSFNDLENIGTKPMFNYIFSDFGGLNCTDRLDHVLTKADALLQNEGKITLVIMPKICPWEMLMIFKGHVKTAFRRLKKGGTMARVEDVYFKCTYYNPEYIIKNLGTRYSVLNLQALALTVPPPYIKHFAERHPKLFSWLEKLENKLSHRAPFNRWGDHFMITLQKNEL